MAGIAGTLGMLAEASGCGAVLDVETRARGPAERPLGDWLTCFPGFAMLTTGTPAPAGPAVTAELRRTGRGHRRHAALARRRDDARHRRRRHRIGELMTTLRMAAVAAPFDRDLEGDFARIEKLIGQARAEGVRLLALPEACLGGYLANLDGGAEGPPALAVDGPEMRRLAALAGRPRRHGGLLRDRRRPPLQQRGLRHRRRRARQPPQGAPAARRERQLRRRPRVRRVRHAGRAARHDDLLRQGVPRIRAGAGAGRRRDRRLHVARGRAAAPTPAPDLAQDRWKRRFDLFDRARALENQIVWLSANQSGTFGDLRFVAQRQGRRPGRRGPRRHRRRRGHGDRRTRRPAGAGHGAAVDGTPGATDGPTPTRLVSREWGRSGSPPWPRTSAATSTSTCSASRR